jgi:hypothetical protein
MTDLDLDSRLHRIESMLDRVMTLLEKYQPVIEAYLDPGASGPGAWAVRRKLRKKEQ